MPSSHSVTQLLNRVKAGDSGALDPLWRQYFAKLVRLARQKLAKRRVFDEEDVVLSALKSFYKGAAAGRFPQLNDRHGLWPLLVKITFRKAIKANMHEARAKRGGGKVLGESALARPRADGADSDGWENMLSREPTPGAVAEMAEESRRLLETVPHELRLRTVAVLKLDGYTDAEIATQLNCSERTVQRKLDQIRNIWRGKVTDVGLVDDR